MAPIKEWYGAYNIIYRWIEQKYGPEALKEYWKHIAEKCFKETSERFVKEGLGGIHDYYSETFDKEGGEYKAKVEKDSLVFEVTRCPDYEFMNSASNPHFKPIENYCRHHEVLNNVLSEKAGYSFCMTECSKKGQCRWEFKKK